MKHKKQSSICTTHNQQGFTLVEFMVASVLGLIVIAGAGALYSHTKRLNDIGMARVNTLQDLRNVSTMVTQDARSAGVFGCANLGRRFAPDSTDGNIELGNLGAGVADIVKLQTLDDPTPANRSAGVRWVKSANVAKELNTVWGAVPFTPDNDSGALLFYYGEGSLSFNSTSGSEVLFNTNERNPNQVVKSILNTAPGGWVVAAGCNALAFKESNGGNSGGTFKVDTLPATATSTATDKSTNSAIVPHSDMILQRYKIVAYVVGEITGEDEKGVPALYRFEFGNNGGNWTAPQKLAKNVTKMEAQYLFVTDCPTGKNSVPGAGAGAAPTAVDLNAQQFTIKNADDGNSWSDDTSVSPNYGKPDAAQGPSSIQLKLTYNFPKIRGGSIETGGTDQEFNISAVVRGGNVCASRKITQ